MFVVRMAMALLCVFAFLLKARSWLEDVRARGRRFKKSALAGGRRAWPRRP
jgi:hypothetical protein